MIATKDSFETRTGVAMLSAERQFLALSERRDSRRRASPHSSEQLRKSKKIYVEGQIHPDVRVPMREIELTPTRSYTGAIEQNEPVRVYDCSGPWGDPDFHGDVEHGLPPLRREWILTRGDVEEDDGRPASQLTTVIFRKNTVDLDRRSVRMKRRSHLDQTALPKRKILRAKPGKVVTQLAYARAGIITPEMEFIAIRENMGRQPMADPDRRLSDLSRDIVSQRPRQAARRHQPTRHRHSAIVNSFVPSVFRTLSTENSERDYTGVRPCLKSLPGAPSSRPTSTIPNPSR